MKVFSNLPPVKEMGFKWPSFEKAVRKINNVSKRRREAQAKEAQLNNRLQMERQEDVMRLAKAIVDGSEDTPPANLTDLADELKEAQRVRAALEVAEPESESELMAVVNENREAWIREVDAALEASIKEEMVAYEKAIRIAQPARERRLAIETLASWIRTTPPVFSVPADRAIPSTLSEWMQDVERCQRQIVERQEREQAEAEANARREAKEREEAEAGVSS